MRIGSVITFGLAVAVSLAAAVHRWGDSGHAIGLLTADGGKARHPSVLTSGWRSYTQITTATVLPPYRGDVRILLEGDPPLDHEIRFAAPVVDLGIRRLPAFRDGVLHGVEPGDRLALWVLMRPIATDPVCGMPAGEGHPSITYRGKVRYFCGEGCQAKFEADPGRYLGGNSPTGTYHLAFYDTGTGRSLLRVPLIFSGKEAFHASGEHH